MPWSLRPLSVLVLLAALCLAPLAHAQDTAPDLDDMVRALAPQPGTDRSIASTGPQRAVSLVIGFDGDSHRLTLAGMKALRTLAGAMQDPSLNRAQFEIIGHAVLPNRPTEAQTLSSRRAQAVAAHLTAFYDIPDSRIVSVRGVGAAQPQSPNASDPLNQRIEFINLGRN